MGKAPHKGDGAERPLRDRTECLAVSCSLANNQIIVSNLVVNYLHRLITGRCRLLVHS